MRSTPLRIAAATWMPWFEVAKDRNGSFRLDGIMLNVLEHLQKSMNFTYTLAVPSDGAWGICNLGNGSCSGMVGMVQRKEVDFGLGPFGMSYNRYGFVDYTDPIFTDYFTTIVPIRPTYDPWKIAKPFDAFTWTGVLLSPLVFLCATALADRILWGRTRCGRWADFAYRVALNQDAAWRVPRRALYQTVFVCVWIAAFLILSRGYASTLVAMLTLPGAVAPLDSVRQLVDQSKFKWFLEAGSMLVGLAKTASEESVLSRLYDGAELKTAGCFENADLLRSGGFASVCDKLSVKALVSSDFGETTRCNFFISSEEFSFVPLAMILPKGSPLKNDLNRNIQLLLQMGLLDPWIEAHTRNASKCATMVDIVNSYERNLHLTAADIMGCNFILIMGLSTAFTVFLLETGRNIMKRIKRW